MERCYNQLKQKPPEMSEGSFYNYKIEKSVAYFLGFKERLSK